MKSGDRISGFFWLSISIIMAIESYRLDLGTFHYPQPGFHPFLASVALGTLSLILLLSNILRGKRKALERGGDISFNRQRFPKVLYTLASLFAYSLLLNILGFILDTMILIGFLIKVVEPLKWRTVIIVSVSVTLLGYVLFGVILQLQLPKGFLGF